MIIKESEIKNLAGTEPILNKSVMLAQYLERLVNNDMEALAILHNVIGLAYKILKDNGVKIIQDLD